VDERATGPRTPPGIGPTPVTSWSWPHPTLPNRYNASVTEVMDVAAEGRRVAVIEGAVWPEVGSEVSVHEDDQHLRRGRVVRVELVLGFRAPARILVWAELTQERIPGEG
jgi:hypothetical protein